jgi:uncharacterized protein (UPF0335 family)
MKMRGRELYIIAGVIAAVVVAAWWFLFFNPTRGKVSKLDQDYQTAQSTLSSRQEQIRRLEQSKKTAPQNKADLVRLNKALPADTAVPSTIIELTQTAKASGLKLTGMSPGDLMVGAPFSIQPFDLVFTGRYFDVEDFLYRIESFVEYRNDTLLVSGHMFHVVGITIDEGDPAYPELQVSITMNGFLWAGTSAAAAPAPAATPAAGGAP